jgi:H+-transporting ATPase
VWGYALLWFFANDRVKLLAYRIFDPVEAKSKSEATEDSKSEVKVDPKAQTKSESETQAEPKPEAKAQPKEGA